MGYEKPLPQIDAASRPFWEGTQRGELLLQECGYCGRFRFPPAPLCPGCRSTRAAWTPVSGEGTVWSTTFFHKAYFPGFADELPYCVAVVELREGPKLFTNLVGVGNAAIEIGMPVRAEFVRATDEVTLVTFRPLAAAAGGDAG